MDTQTRLGLETAGAALVLGVAADVLLRATPWGLNACIWIACLAVTGYALLQRWRRSLLPFSRWLIVPLGVLALLFLGRDADMLKGITAVALCSTLAFGVYQVQLSYRRQHPSIEADPPGLLLVAFRALAGWPGFVTRGIDWGSLRTDQRSQQVTAVLRGVVIAGPVLAVFGGLLIAADAMFEKLISSSLSVNISALPGHLLLTGLFVWIVGSYLSGILQKIGPTSQSDIDEASRLFSLGIVEIAVVLSLVNALFTVFTLTQISYLFGGLQLVSTAQNLTLATYARRGFFELMLVVILALPLLMGLRRILRADTVRQLRVFRALASVHVGLLILLLASAAHRMSLYAQVYGLTELRLYVSACIVWLAFVLVWFMLTALQDHARRFVPGAVAAGFVFVLALHALNPDAFIARTNVARALEGKRFDAAYTASLSGDAVPLLLESLPHLDPHDRDIVATILLHRWHTGPRRGWLTWSRSRRTAHQAVHMHVASLERFAAFEGSSAGEGAFVY